MQDIGMPQHVNYDDINPTHLRLAENFFVYAMDGYHLEGTPVYIEGQNQGPILKYVPDSRGELNICTFSWFTSLRDAAIKEYNNSELKKKTLLRQISTLKDQNVESSMLPYLDFSFKLPLQYEQAGPHFMNSVTSDIKARLREAWLGLRQGQLKHLPIKSWADIVQKYVLVVAALILRDKNTNAATKEILYSQAVPAIRDQWRIATVESISLPDFASQVSPESTDSLADYLQKGEAEEARKEVPERGERERGTKEREVRKEDQANKVQNESQRRQDQKESHKAETRLKDRSCQTEAEEIINKNKYSDFNIIGDIVVPNRITDILKKGFKFIPSLQVSKRDVSDRIEHLSAQMSHIGQSFNEKAFIKTELQREGNAIKAKLKKFHKPLIQKQLQECLIWLENNHIVVKQADKNLGLCLCTRDWYIAQVMTHLNDENTYKRVNKPVLNYHYALLRKVLSKHGMLSNVKDFIPDKTAPAEFHVLPKIHKTPIKTRPIVPGHSHFTRLVSEFLAVELQPVIDTYPWVIKRQLDFVNLVENTVVTTESCILASFDVESMYPSIIIERAINEMRNLLLTHWNTAKVSYILDLMEWVLNNNFFTFQNEWFLQIKGVAMGTSCAPQFANLYLICYEVKQLKTDLWFGRLYARYLDDIFIISESVKQTGNLHLDINSWTPDLKFTLDLGIYEQNFLDVVIFKGFRYNNKRLLDVKMFVKPTNLHLFTDPQTNYPNSYKFGWILGEQIRIIRNSSSLRDYNESINELRAHLSRRNYDKTIQNKYLRRYYSKTERIYLLSKREKPDEETRRIFIKHDAFWAKYKRLVYKTLEKFNSHFELDVKIQPIILKGKSLIDFTNTTNKKVLQSMSQTKEIGVVGVKSSKRQLSPSKSEGSDSRTNSHERHIRKIPRKRKSDPPDIPEKPEEPHAQKDL